MSASAKAVFLSYASQDAEVARRICDVLRQAGIEVWFDADGGLEHGDEWDAKIRRQIKECVLFIPIISASTQARHEGYFRIEWELAAERAMGIAAGVPFILPIVIDGTGEPEALVPDRFRKVQWTRIPEGKVPPEVQARIVKLWSHRTGVLSHEAACATAGDPTPARAPFAPASQRTRPWKWLALAAAAVAVVAAGAWFATRRPAAPAPVAAAAPTPKEKADAATVAGPVVTKPRGVAVLPFENLDAADQAFFATGVTVEVTDRLQKISALRVMSREAVARFKGAAELPAMARELNIGAILTGTVRRAGDVVRVSVQLIGAPSGEVLWSEQYNGPAKDVFAVQADVAVRVARALQAALAPHERARIERPPTTDTEAYALFLKAESNRNLTESIELYQRAIALDPKFALAYSGLAHRYVFLGYRAGGENFNRAVEAGRTAVLLDPQLARAHQTLASALFVSGREDEARLVFHRALELDANLAHAYNDLSVLETLAGHLDQAFHWAKRGFPLAPNLANSFYHVAIPLMPLDDAVAERWLKAGAARFPVDHPTRGDRLQILLAQVEFRRGQPAAGCQRLRNAVAALPQNFECQQALADLLFLAGAPDAVERIDRLMQRNPGARLGYSGYSARTARASLWLKSGDRERALPLIDAVLAENRAAIAAGNRTNGPLYENATLHLMRGDRAAALESLEAACNAGFRDLVLLKMDPLLAPLANEPRFIQVIDRIDRDVREMRARIDLREIDGWIKDSQR